MPHDRLRYLLAQLKKDLRWSKTVCILGMRQVGKTTLARKLSQSYFSFDEGSVRNRALQEDWSFLEGASPPIALDECQIVPGSFSQVKFRVDQSPRPGQFLLTGSVRFLSKKDIRESLTGRTSILELLPMSLSEAHQKPLSDFFAILNDHPSDQKLLSKLRNDTRFSLENVKKFSEIGGLPGICFRRDDRIRERLWEIQLETVLSRDIEMIAPTRLGYLKIRKLLSEVFSQAGLPVNKALLAKRINTSGPTISRLLDAFESLFLAKRHGTTYYPTDLGLFSHLARNIDFTDRAAWLRIVFVELRTQLEYRYRSRYEFGEMRTRGGMDIPFLVDVKKLGRFAITVDAESHVSDKSLKSLTWYKKRSPHVRAVCLHLGEKAYFSSAGHLCLPLHWIF